MELCYRWARGSRENEKKKKNQESAGQPVCLLQICNSSVTLFEQTLPPSLSSMPPLSVNPPHKETNVSSPGDEHTGMFNQANGVPSPSPGPPTNRWLGEQPGREARKPVWMSAGWAPAAAALSPYTLKSTHRRTQPNTHAHQHASTCNTIPYMRHAQNIHPVTLSVLRIWTMTTHAHPCETRVPWQHVFPQRRPVILRLKEFAVDYFWTEAGSFGKERPGHFEDLTSSSHCLPTALGAAQAPAAHIFTHHLMKLYVKDSSTMRPLRRNTRTESV